MRHLQSCAHARLHSQRAHGAHSRTHAHSTAKLRSRTSCSAQRSAHSVASTAPHPPLPSHHSSLATRESAQTSQSSNTRTCWSRRGIHAHHRSSCLLSQLHTCGSGTACDPPLTSCALSSTTRTTLHAPCALPAPCACYTATCRPRSSAVLSCSPPSTLQLHPFRPLRSHQSAWSPSVPPPTTPSTRFSTQSMRSSQMPCLSPRSLMSNNASMTSFPS